MEEMIPLKRGKTHILCSTLVSLPIYCMSLFPILRIVRLRLEKTQKDFL